MNSYRKGTPLPEGTEVQYYNMDGNAVPDCTLIVIYHAFCADGFGAAWAIHQAALAERDSLPQAAQHLEVLYVPATYGARDQLMTELRPLFPYADVAIVDFSLPLADIITMEECAARSVTILDHHKGAAPMLEEINAAADNGTLSIPVNAIFNNDHSGAVMAWKYYVMANESENIRGRALPEVLKYVQDRDLWTWALEDTKAVMAAVYSYEFTMDKWDDFSRDDAIASLRAEGAAINRTRDKDIAAHAEAHNITFATFGGVPMVYCNAPYYVVSELCHLLLEHYPEVEVAAGWQSGGAGKGTVGRVRWSFRARKDGADLPAMLAPFGGGGHQAASGLELASNDPKLGAFMSQFDKWPDEE